MTRLPLPLVLACVLLTAPIGAASAQTPAGVEAAQSRQAQDRRSILAMAGDYKVRFDMRETVAFAPGYKLLEPKVTGGNESVRVVEDSPGKIVLQHLLVGEVGGKPMVIKHWRQDWVYEPATVLTYAASGRWTLTPVSADARKGAWSQTVWQTDDSPRYGGVGRWVYDNGVASWQSEPTRRPLARRDAIRKPVYGWYVGINRHSLTPVGWVHEQDNAKIGLKDGKTQLFANEVVLNSYVRDVRYNVAAADAYWSKTKDYWSAVRLAWDQEIARGRGVSVTEEADNGSITGPKLMGLAEEIADGAKDQRAAVAEAKAIIAGAERTRPLALRR